MLADVLKPKPKRSPLQVPSAKQPLRASGEESLPAVSLLQRVLVPSARGTAPLASRRLASLCLAGLGR